MSSLFWLALPYPDLTFANWLAWYICPERLSPDEPKNQGYCPKLCQEDTNSLLPTTDTLPPKFLPGTMLKQPSSGTALIISDSTLGQENGGRAAFGEVTSLVRQQPIGAARAEH